MLRDSRLIAEVYASVPAPIGPSVVTKTDVPTTASIANEEPKKEAPKQNIKDWIRLEPGLCPIDTVRKADHTAHTILQFIYSICASPDAVHRILKTINKAYKQDHK
jgi:hypothetical protein